MSILQELGLTREEIEQKVIEKMVSDLMSEYVYETETGASYPENSRLARRFMEVIKKHVDAQMEKLAQDYVVPKVAELVEAVAIHHTNSYGETTGKSQTFVEYLTSRADGYLNQTVDYDGKPIERGGYNKPEQTRLMHLVNKSLHYSIETAMKDAAEIVRKQLGATLEQTVKLKLQDIAKTISVQVSK